MGSANALAAYRLYGGKVPPVSMNALAYMALVALDKHQEPAWWEGHEMLAIRCFGYTEPVGEAGLRAVRRAITPLFSAGAITTIRHASGHHGRIVTARYRLWLVDPAPDGKRPKRELSIGRKTSEHRTISGRAQDGNRPTKEEEEKEERDIRRAGAVNGTVEGNGSAPDQDHDSPDTRTPEGTADAAAIASRELAKWEAAQPIKRAARHALDARPAP
jgi:hypothetical protein